LTTSAIVRSDVPSDVLKVKEAPVKEIQNVLQSPEKLKHDEDLKKEITIEGVVSGNSISITLRIFNKIARIFSFFGGGMKQLVTWFQLMF